MPSAETPWGDHLKRLGDYIRSQRHLSQLTQRQLAELAALSDTYMSQLERGLHEPSIRVLRAVAAALDVSADDLIRRAAALDDVDDGAEPSAEEAIRRDPRLTESQRAALLGVLRSYVESNSARRS